MIRPIFIPFLIACVAVIPFAAAQEAATIKIKKSDALDIAVKPFAGSDAAIASKIVANDLDLSGYFSVGQPDRALYLVAGNSAAGNLQGTLTDNRGGILLQKSYSGPTRFTAHQFASDIIKTITGHPGLGTTRIAFVSNRTGSKEIYMADYDGANQRQITNDRSISVAPALSPDGSTLAYTGYQSGYADIYSIDVATGARTKILKFPGTNSGASFSPEGGRIACTLSKDGNPELYIVAANGSGARRLTRSKGVESSPTWSPDGTEILFSSDERGGPQLFRISAAGGVPRLVSTGFSYCTEPSWSPDGKKIAFTVRQGGFSIAVMDLATGSTRVVADGQDPAWGADSRHLIYSDGSSIMLLDTVRGRKTPVVAGLGKVSEPTWSR